MYDVAIIGGGLAGLISAIGLAKGGMSIVLFEKRQYPFHRVCGEYISNEVVPFLEKNSLFPNDLNPARINRFQLTSTNGRSAEVPLKLGGFGISRYAFDEYLYKKANSVGVECFTGVAVDHVEFENDQFNIKFGSNSCQAKWVISAHGKRSTLDKQMNRSFMSRRSPYVGVKYHIKTDFPEDVIALHNFKNGYCGISKVEGDTYNLCYLTHRNNIRSFGSVKEMENEIMHKNPYLKEIFQNSEFLFDKPMVINEINFERKNAVERHILMCGDSAGMIAPLCGNGMAMAIHSAKILSEVLLKFNTSNGVQRSKVEQAYKDSWNQHFATRLRIGRSIQKLFGSTMLSDIAVRLVSFDPIAHSLIKMTHGKPF